MSRWRDQGCFWLVIAPGVVLVLGLLWLRDQLTRCACRHWAWHHSRTDAGQVVCRGNANPYGPYLRCWAHELR